MGDRIRVLVVVDHPPLLERVHRAFADAGGPFEVTTTHAPAGARDNLDGDSVECIVSDMQTALQGSRPLLEIAGPVGADVPFVLIDGTSSDPDNDDQPLRVMTSISGADPIASDRELADRVRSVVSWTRSDRGSPAPLTHTNGGLSSAVRSSDHGGSGPLFASDQSTHQELAMYRTIVETSGDPMYIVDISGQVTYVNDAYLELTGYDRVELIGRDVRIMSNEEDYAAGTELIRTLLQSDADTGTVEMDIRTASGDLVPCENHITLIYDVDSADRTEVTATVGVLRDITDRKERLAELRRQNERLERLASVLSHDLRNPLSVAKGRIELAVDECGCEHLEPSATALERMEELIDTLVDLARTGQRVSEPEWIDIDPLARRSWENVQTAAATITVERSLRILADPTRLAQLFENLFRNAIEHGGTAVTVRIGVLESEAGFFMADDGPGIPTDRRDEVFDYRFSTDRSGNGLGLAIVNDIVEAHGWEIRLTDATDGGARFEVTDVETTPP